jgi:hypothetical protein
MKRLSSVLIVVLILAAYWQNYGQKLPDKFPPLYKGDLATDIRLFIGYKGQKLAKDEFETANEAAQRVGKLFSESKINGHSLANVIVVFVPKCTYNAEAKFFDCSSFEYDGSERFPDDRLGERFYISNAVESYGFRWTWQIDSATARQTKPDLRVAIVGRPEYSMRGLTFNVAQMALFNYTTGEIYKLIKLPPKKTETDTPAIIQ